MPRRTCDIRALITANSVAVIPLIEKVVLAELYLIFILYFQKCGGWRGWEINGTAAECLLR
jgi:hypothetical protein